MATATEKPDGPNADGKGNQMSLTIKPRRGLIGFFDILGYKSFLHARNTPADVTTKVLATLLSLQRELPDEFIKHFGEDDERLYAPHVKSLEWLVFSDTVVLTADTESLSKSADKGIRLAIFLYQCAILYRHLFDFGMPVRGSIETGTFYVAQTCFAGSPFVQAYERVSQLECAVCVVAPDAIAYYDGETNEGIAKVLATYHVPLKGGSYAPYSVLQPHYRPKNVDAWRTADLRQVVMQSFWAHGKQMTDSAVIKADNTERLLRYLKMTEPDHFN